MWRRVRPSSCRQEMRRGEGRTEMDRPSRMPRQEEEEAEEEEGGGVRRWRSEWLAFEKGNRRTRQYEWVGEWRQGRGGGWCCGWR